MRVTHYAVFLLAMLIPSAFAQSLTGTWEASFVGGTPGSAKPIRVDFDLFVNANLLTGTAYMSSWGMSDVSDGKLDGDHFSFTAIRSYPPAGGVTRVAFEGTFDGTVTNLTMMERDRAHPMKVERVESKVVAPVSVNASAEDVTGTWKAWWVGRIGDRPKMISDVSFDFKLEGTVLSGTAHLDHWPGDAPITDGRFEAGHFSFIAIGKLPSSSGLPKLKFEGTIHGKEMKLMLIHEDASPQRRRELPMDAKKL